MDTGILKMPVICGVPLYRETPISSNTLLRSVDVRTNPHFDITLRNPDIVLGSDITKSPSRIFKSIAVFDRDRVVIETTFSIERDAIVCLYVKLIYTNHTEVLVSMHGINTYRGGDNSVIPLPLLVKHKYWKRFPLKFDGPFETIVRPIFDIGNLEEEVVRTVDTLESSSNSFSDYGVIDFLYKNAPDILSALVSGRFDKSPLRKLLHSHPAVNLTEDRWFFKDISGFSSRVKSGTIHYNQQEFDSIVHRFISIRPAKMSMTMLISHAIDGMIDLGITRHFFDPYLHLFGSNQSLFDSIKKDVSDIAFRAVLAYCQIYDIDYSEFLRTPNNNSSITIDKNIHDEVTISFHDLINDRYVCFYTCYPLIVLGTFGVGRLI